jgi:hypothetical protein
VNDPTSGMASYAVTVQRANIEGKLMPPNTTPTTVTCNGTTCSWTADLGSSNRHATYRITITTTDVAGNKETTFETLYA